LSSGWNHSGRLGSINWLHSTMGLANAQRSLDYISTIAGFVSRPEVAEVRFYSFCYSWSRGEVELTRVLRGRTVTVGGENV